MKRVLAHITARSEVFAQEPMFQYLRNKDIAPEQRLAFMPMMAHFVFSFMDVNMYILRNEALDTPFQRLINIHTYEDASHWPWWIRDMKSAGFDKACSLTDAMQFTFSEATRRSRMLTYDFIATAAKATPTQLLAIVETVESTGYQFLSTTAEVCREIDHNPFVYYGSKHSDVESGHHMGTDEVVGYLETIELSDQELEETKALVDGLYRSYTEFVGEMYDWVMSHDLGELLSQPFFRERVTGQVSRPLNPTELIQRGSPVMGPIRQVRRTAQGTLPPNRAESGHEPEVGAES
jgi:hypothetical protein